MSLCVCVCVCVCVLESHPLSHVTLFLIFRLTGTYSYIHHVCSLNVPYYTVLTICASPACDVTLPECMASSAAPSSPGQARTLRNIVKTCSKMSTRRRSGGWLKGDTGAQSVRGVVFVSADRSCSLTALVQTVTRRS